MISSIYLKDDYFQKQSFLTQSVLFVVDIVLCGLWSQQFALTGGMPISCKPVQSFLMILSNASWLILE